MAAAESLAALTVWEREAIHGVIAATVEKLDVGFGKVAMPLRAAVTDGVPSPDLDLTLWLIGKEAVLRRINNAVAHIEAKGE